ncbi:hypothetical protein I2F27_06635 [Acinetobacter sp. B5B]|uniref:hypothetical protein n=1 Tax=Acinetobacter TaxID=469 RepID=UPI0018A2B3E6|nr:MULTISPECIES: hypothetical protein [Acinetobacter]MBF7683002.1 hypothetical protein [Acinetobacter baretiae]MBF7696176.1 hypothetical protein [Acinetobacter rathckeae]
MKWKFFLVLITCSAFSGSPYAAQYQETKQRVKSALVKCLKDPGNQYSATYNACLLDAYNMFQAQAKIEFDEQYKSSKEFSRIDLRKTRDVYNRAIKNCEIFQNVYDGFTKEAVCKLGLSRDYLIFLKSGQGVYPSSWKVEDKVDHIYITY